MFGGRTVDGQRLIEAAAKRIKIEALYLLWTATLVIRDIDRCTVGRLGSAICRLQFDALSCWRTYETAQRRAVFIAIRLSHGPFRFNPRASLSDLPDIVDSDAEGCSDWM